MKSVRDLRISKSIFEDIQRGNNLLEVAKNRRTYQPGDVIQLQEIDEASTLTGRTLRRRITYIVSEHSALPVNAGCLLIALATENGADMIRAERQRQISQEGWTAEHDDSVPANSEKPYPLRQAAVAYAIAAGNPAMFQRYEAPECWPWAQAWWKPASPIRMLVKAGALLAAEIDRRLRAGETP